MLKPLRDYIVAENEKAEEKTKSGFYIPESAKEKPRIAKVLEVGGDIKEVTIGDRVIYKAYATTEITFDDQEYILVKEEDLLAIVKENK